MEKVPAVKFIGETSRSAFDRNKEHHDDFKNIRASSHILKHYMESHRDIKMEDLEMRMRVIKKYKTSFERQIGESIWIYHNLKEGTLLLNSNNEYNRCSIPRLGINLTKEDIIEEYKESQREVEFRREIMKLREEIRRGSKKEENRSKKLKLAVVCREIIQENQFEWNMKRRKDKREKEERELQESKTLTKLKKINATKLEIEEKRKERNIKKKMKPEDKKKLATEKRERLERV